MKQHLYPIIKHGTRIVFLLAGVYFVLFAACFINPGEHHLSSLHLDASILGWLSSPFALMLCSLYILGVGFVDQHKTKHLMLEQKMQQAESGAPQLSAGEHSDLGAAN